MKKILLMAALAIPLLGHAQQILPKHSSPFRFLPPQLNPAVPKGMSNNSSGTVSKRITSIRLFGVGGLDDLTRLNQTGGSASIGAMIDFGRAQYAGQDSLREIPGTDIYRHELYLAFNAKAANTADTSALARTFLFPDISKRDLTAGYGRILNLKDNPNWTFMPYVELSTSRNILTRNDSTIQFRSYSVTVGTRFDFEASIPMGSEEKPFGLSFIPYYNLITVDSKEFASYNLAFNETHMPPTFHTVGVKALITLANFTIFGNYKRVLNRDADLGTNDLKGGNIVIGAVVDASILRHAFSGRSLDNGDEAQQ